MVHMAHDASSRGTGHHKEWGHLPSGTSAGSTEGQFFDFCRMITRSSAVLLVNFWLMVKPSCPAPNEFLNVRRSRPARGNMKILVHWYLAHFDAGRDTVSILARQYIGVVVVPMLLILVI